MFSKYTLRVTCNLNINAYVVNKTEKKTNKKNGAKISRKHTSPTKKTDKSRKNYLPLYSTYRSVIGASCCTNVLGKPIYYAVPL